jgi:hypothetical protein
MIPEVELLHVLLENSSWRDERVGMAELRSWSCWRLSKTCTRRSGKWNLVRRRNGGDDKVEDRNEMDIGWLIIRVGESRFILFSKHMHIVFISCMWCVEVEV